MSNKTKTYTIEDLLEKAKTYLTKQEELDKIKKAYEFAETHHQGQFRKSGEAYIIHPIHVSVILTTIYADCDTICAGLLHDVIEDCDVERKELEEEFGKEVAFLVDGVSKLGRLHFSTENEYLIEYYKKIIVGMSEDVRVIIIKLADRLHNMRTLWALSPERQKANAKETLEILAPIAGHLGIHKIKSELEDLSLRYMKPEVFYDIAEKLNNTKLERDKYVHEMMEDVSDILDRHGIKHEIKGRSKSIYSIYRKLDKGRKFSDIYDLLALRVFVNTEEECYQVLGLVHSKYKPIPNRFKDYVAMPKPNMYQSLHTTVFGIDGYLFEIQIRTYEMDEIAENGIAAHWAYKEGKTNGKDIFKNSTEKKLQFFKEIIELNEEKMSTEDFVASVKDEVLNNNIYVFTPKGDVFELPIGATPIDFAYKIHTQVGETMVGALVNNSIVPLDYQLRNNDIVKIQTSKTSTGPKKEWLNICKCTQTKNKIKAFFTRSEKDINIERGKQILEKELRKRKVAFQEFFSPENKTKIFDEIKVKDLDELYLNVGTSKFSPNMITNIILKPDEDKGKPRIFVKSDDADIIVEGIDKIKVNLANCCNPVPGDEIIGYITRGNGITVHRRNCHNVAMHNGRIIDVSWSEITNKKYIASIMIFTNTRDNKVFDIIQRANMDGIGIHKMNTLSRGDGTQYELDCLVTDLEHLNRYMINLEKESFIIKIDRLIR